MPMRLPKAALAGSLCLGLTYDAPLRLQKPRCAARQTPAEGIALTKRGFGPTLFEDASGLVALTVVFFWPRRRL